MALEIGNKAPDFTLPVVGYEGGDTIILSEVLKTGPAVVYFYPKDMTPGCTTEACDFRDNMARLTSHGVTVIGISKDSVERHEKFREKHELSFPLASDIDGTVIEAYDCWKEKSMYGKTFMGIVRATFLIGTDGIVKAAWPKVRVKGHVDEVLEAIEAI